MNTNNPRTNQRHKTVGNIVLSAAFGVALALFGCQSPPPAHPAIDDSAVNDASKDFIMWYTNYDDKINVSIYNISKESVFIYIPIRGLPFDLDYVTTNGTLKRISSSEIFSHGSRYILYHLYCINYDPERKTVLCCSNLPLTFTKPADLEKVLKLECEIKFIKNSDFKKIKNKNDLEKIIYSRYTTLSVVSPDAHKFYYDEPDENGDFSENLMFDEKTNLLGILQNY